MHEQEHIAKQAAKARAEAEAPQVGRALSEAAAGRAAATNGLSSLPGGTAATAEGGGRPPPLR